MDNSIIILNMKQALISFALIIIAMLLFCILIIPGLLWQLYKIIANKLNYAYISSVLFSVAQCLDQLGNVIFQELFNDILIMTNGYKFGDHQETISSVLGKNFELHTLSKTGIFLNNCLNNIQANHTVISIETNVNSAESKN